jgi:hypothetical protein
LKAAAVFQDVFTAIPFGKTEIEHFLAVQKADAAWAGAEAVDEPGEFCECGDLQDLDAASFKRAPTVEGGAWVSETRAASFLGRCIRERHSDTSIISVV